MSADSPQQTPTVATAGSKGEAPIAIAVSAPVVAPAEPATRNVQFWLNLTPLLSILITAATLLINSYLSFNQTRRTEQAAEASEWRQALNKLSEGSSNSELATMLQMESFFTSNRYHKDARSIAATLASDSPNPYAFDIVVFRMVPDTTEENQGDLLLVDQALSNQAMQLFASLKHRPQSLALFNDAEFQHFLVSPEDVVTDADQTEQLKQAKDLNWKIDSVSSAITTAWARRQIQPGKSRLDLNGIVFLNQDHRNFDFSNIDLTRTAFLGRCAVPPNLPHTGVVACQS